MEPILYVETNFMIGVAKGQDVLAGRSLDEGFSGIHVAVPGVCFMEALSVLSGERKQRNRFHDDLRRHAREASRDRTSVHAPSLANHLELSVIESDDLFNEIENRLYEVLGRLSADAEVIDLHADAVGDCIHQDHLDDPADNLILCSVLRHARSTPREPKAFLSGNSGDFGQFDVKATLAGAGVEYFPRLGDALKWLRSRSSGGARG